MTTTQPCGMGLIDYMQKEIKNLLSKLQENFAINECDSFEETCADCRASRLYNDLKWLLTLED